VSIAGGTLAHRWLDVVATDGQPLGLKVLASSESEARRELDRLAGSLQLPSEQLDIQRTEGWPARTRSSRSGIAREAALRACCPNGLVAASASGRRPENDLLLIGGKTDVALSSVVQHLNDRIRFTADIPDIVLVEKKTVSQRRDYHAWLDGLPRPVASCLSVRSVLGGADCFSAWVIAWVSSTRERSLSLA
jgi:hypothetical protein